MFVKDLKKALENLDDNLRVTIDTEARTFNCHLVAVDKAFVENPMGDEKILILRPDYSGTTHCKCEEK